MKLGGAYRYLYYRFYLLNKRMWFGYSEPPHLQNVSALFAFQFLNLLTAVFLLHGFTGEWYLPPTHGTFMFGVAILFFINYFAFGSGGRHIAIIREFEREHGTQRKLRSLFFWSYLIGSIMACFISLFWAVG